MLLRCGPSPGRLTTSTSHPSVTGVWSNSGMRRQESRSGCFTSSDVQLGPSHSQDASSRRVLVTYRGHAAEVWDVAWSPARTYIASTGDGGIVQVWNASTGRQAFGFHI